ncbi:MAG TPA: cupredoxin family copper-binding protein [Gemmatimonadales bacterium]|nr:cupredoxin family copper-binding protein [Gemmatimonadales bacterium]
MPSHRVTLATALGALALASPAVAQTVLDRSPNLAGAWVGSSGMLHFNFLHRFQASTEPERKVTSTPTFLLAGGLPWHTLVGAHYASNSELSPRYPNEWEFFGRVAVLDQESGAPLDLSAQLGYNLAAEEPDGEIAVARRQGPVRILAAGRLLGDPDGIDGPDVALGAGLVLRLTQHIGFSGDVVSLTERDPGEKIAWGAGINLAIPRTPHTLSLHATNVNNATLQSSSRGTDETRYGFEFTIPLTLSRYFGRGSPQPEQAAPPEGAPKAGPDTAAADTAAAEGAATLSARVEDFSFEPARLEVQRGTTVTWTNQGQVIHTVTANDGSFDSGQIDSGAKGSITFSRPGTYEYHCTPHPFMRGVVVVQ